MAEIPDGSIPAGSFAASARVVARRDAMLPTLLGAVRWRRRRRRVLSAAAVAGACAALLWLTLPRGRGETAAPGEAPPRTVAAWTTFRDDGTILARCVMPTTTRAEWFVDDAGLHAMLAAAERPAGVVRVGGRVVVDPAAVDPFPADADPLDAP